jgi:hypothetical protein
MPGVVRPYTLVDVLGTLNSQSQGSSNVATTISGLGYFAEADETVSSTDSASTLVTANLGWDQGAFNAITWD